MEKAVMGIVVNRPCHLHVEGVKTNVIPISQKSKSYGLF